MERHFTVAIDGPSGAGKSTLAKAVAQKMGALYLDTGAMYRAVGLAALERGTDMADQDQVAGLLESLQVDVRYQDGGQRVYLNGQDVSEAIRQPRVSSAASQVSAVPAVREKLVAMQRQIAQGKSVVMDGRDIGTKVLPDATLKIYLAADLEERAHRRHRELQDKGLPDSYEQVRRALEKRDHDDSCRAASPLCQAADAVALDCTRLSQEQTVERVLDLLRQRLGVEA